MSRRGAAPAITEKQLQGVVMECAQRLGWTCYHTWLSARSAPGFPDLVCVRSGAMKAIELKSERGKLTAHQEHWLGILGAVPGVSCHVWRPADWTDGQVEKALR